MKTAEKFENLGLSENVLKAIAKKGFEEPTPIQEKVIPILLKGNIDIVGQAETGTGKTAAFGLPLIERLDEKSKNIQTLILTPTRELAIQISEELNSLKGKKRLKILPVYGGQSIELQFRQLKYGVDIVVGTPGRILDHIRRGTINFKEVSYVVLDEADEMLNMGFIEDVDEILKHTKQDKRMMLFSATMPNEILRIAKKHMGEYELIKTQTQHLTTDLTEQIYFEVSNSDKFESLCRIIDIQKEIYALIFCRTKVDVDTLANKLSDRGYDTLALHGDMSQNMRERVLNKFKHRKSNILVATDVAARGIDIENLTHVINYSIPQDVESYIHRIGRTGRAGKEGIAITFVTPNEYRRLVYMARSAKINIKKQEIPKVGDIISTKILRIQSEIDHIIESDEQKDFEYIARMLINEHPETEIIAALLKYAFGDELDEKSYRRIREVSVDTYAKSRLFVALGKDDGMTLKKLVDFIKQQTGVEGRNIKEVRIFDEFSFITVPFEEAEIILETFKRNKKGKRSIVSKAKERRGSGQNKK